MLMVARLGSVAAAMCGLAVLAALTVADDAGATAESRAKVVTPGTTFDEMVKGATTVDVEGHLGALLEQFDAADVAGKDDDADGVVTMTDLTALATGGASDVQRAAQYLVDNPTVFRLAQAADDSRNSRPRRNVLSPLPPDLAWKTKIYDGRMSKDDLEAFMQARMDLKLIYPKRIFDVIDVARRGGEPDGWISKNDLMAAADDKDLADEVRSAVRRLGEHPHRWNWLDGEDWEGGSWAYGDTGPRDVDDKFDRMRLHAYLVNAQVDVDSAKRAFSFVTGLPTADDGKSGLNRRLFYDDGVRALAGAAWVHADGDLIKEQKVIAHLPETNNAVRNDYITGFYKKLAVRAGQLLGEAGDRLSPGNNWLDYAPWASAAVHKAIAGEESAFGLELSSTGRQAAADGNQWIFNDITSKFAAFVSMYERSPDALPTRKDLEKFFEDTELFPDGSKEIRHAFVLYAASTLESDPAEKQRLVFMGNVAIAIHEQAGADRYVDDALVVNDSAATNAIPPMGVGRHGIHLYRDLDLDQQSASALIDDNEVLELDPANRPERELTKALGISLARISGWSGAFQTTPADWHREEGGGRDDARYQISIRSSDCPGEALPSCRLIDDPDATLKGTRVFSWGDYEDRMWFIYRMFEQLHTDPSVHQPESPATDSPVTGMYDITRCASALSDVDSTSLSSVDFVNGVAELGPTSYATATWVGGSGGRPDALLFTCAFGGNQQAGFAAIPTIGPPSPSGGTPFSDSTDLVYGFGWAIRSQPMRTGTNSAFDAVAAIGDFPAYWVSNEYGEEQGMGSAASNVTTVRPLSVLDTDAGWMLELSDLRFGYLNDLDDPSDWPEWSASCLQAHEALVRLRAAGALEGEVAGVYLSQDGLWLRLKPGEPDEELYKVQDGSATRSTRNDPAAGIVGSLMWGTATGGPDHCLARQATFWYATWSDGDGG